MNSRMPAMMIDDHQRSPNDYGSAHDRDQENAERHGNLNVVHVNGSFYCERAQEASLDHTLYIVPLFGAKITLEEQAM